MVLRTVATINDTITSEESPSTTYSRRPTLTMRATSGARTFGYVSARGLRPDPRAQVNSAVLRLFAAETATSSTHTVRQVLAGWDASTLRWGNQPAGPGPTITTEVTALVADQPVDFDVTSEVARWLTSGAPNYGFRLENSATVRDGRSFHSVNATGTKAAFRPALLVDVSYPPDAPAGVTPVDGSVVTTSEPVVTWQYGGIDVAPMLAYQVQTNPNDVWTSPATDTGEVASTVPQHQLTGIDGDDTWFRIRHKSVENRWSDWSDGSRLSFEGLPAVTITSTESSTSDPSPTTTWTVTGGTQVAFQVLLRRGSLNGPVVADSGVLVGDDGQWEPARNLSVPIDADLFREVRVWGSTDHAATVGQPAYSSATYGPFVIAPAAAIDPATELAVSSTEASPAASVSWSLAATPDSVIVERSIDGGDWRRFELEVADVALGGGGYLWRDVTAPAEHVLTYRVRPVVNGSMGQAPNQASVTLRASFIWLADPDDADWVLPVAGPDAGVWALGEDSSVYNVRGSDRSTLIHEGFRGYEGSVSGTFPPTIRDWPFSAQDLRDRSWRTKAQPTKVWRLVIADMNIPVTVRNVNPVPMGGDKIRFGFSLDFLQQGELPWEDQ